MANRTHLAILRQGIEAWNQWREQTHDTPDLGGADLRGIDLTDANLANANMAKARLVDAMFGDTNFRRANLDRAVFSPRPPLHGSHFREARLTNVQLDHVMLEGMDLIATDFSGSQLREADLSKTTLLSAHFKDSDLRGVRLNGADLRDADLRGADLRRASLERANLVRTKLGKAKLQDCRVHGLSAWDVDLTKATQANLVITRYDQPEVTVDDLEVAQLVYLLINNQRIRKVIETVTSKVVLILGRFTPARKAILDALRAELRRHNYVPILFDFDKPTKRDLDETVSILAHMARFIIADLTDARSLPQELKGIVENLPSVPVQPLLLASKKEWAMFNRYERFPWVLPIVRYRDQKNLLKNLAARVITPAERWLSDNAGP